MDEIKWKWFTAPCPSIGWDSAFLAPEDLLTAADKYDKWFPVRGLGKLDIIKTKEGKRALQLVRYLPGNFGCIDLLSEGRISRGLFPFIFPATDGASTDWEKTWTEPVEESDIIVGSEAEAEQLAAQAGQMAQLAESMKRGPRGLVKR